MVDYTSRNMIRKEKLTKIKDQIIMKFNDIGSIENMSKCTPLLNTNVNESIHHRTFGIVSKALSYSVEHVEFAAELARCIHNFGYEKTFGTWYTSFGEYNMEEQMCLKQKDRLRVKNASEEKQVKKKKKKVLNILRKQPLKLSEVWYIPNCGFEHHPPEGVDEFHEDDPDDEDLGEL